MMGEYSKPKIRLIDYCQSTHSCHSDKQNNRETHKQRTHIYIENRRYEKTNSISWLLHTHSLHSLALPLRDFNYELYMMDSFICFQIYIHTHIYICIYIHRKANTKKMKITMMMMMMVIWRWRGINNTNNNIIIIVRSLSHSAYTIPTARAQNTCMHSREMHSAALDHEYS